MKIANKTRVNLLKIFILVFCIALFLTGCATVSDVKDKNGKNIYFDDVVYFQGQIAIIGDYLYYGNSYTASDGETFDYKTAASTGYLSRLNISNLKYSDKEDENGYTNPSPIGTQQVNDRFVGFQNQFMFALGEYLYFTSVNTHSTGSLENDYTQVSLFRIKFNGDNFSELDGVKSTFRYDENTVLTVQKGSDNKYYIIVYAPISDEEDTSYNLYSIKIGDNVGKVITLAEDVTSVAICDENSTLRNIIYTIDAENEYYPTTAVKSVDFATGEVFDYSDNLEVHGSETILQDRIGDIVIYSYKSSIVPQAIFYKDLINSDNYFNGSNEFYVSSGVSQVEKAGDGYIFLSDTSGSLMYKPTLGSTTSAEENYVDPTPKKILGSDEFSDVLFVDGDYVYYSNDTTISRVSVRDLSNKKTLVTMSSLISGQCGYDGTYIYFYAQLQETESSDEESESEETTSADTNYYLFRVDKTGSENNTQLLSKVVKK